MKIAGKWKKVSEAGCNSTYPENIEFNINGIYIAGSSLQSKSHPVWDSGTFQISGGTIKMSTSNDAIISYFVTQKDNNLIFKAPDDCEIIYERMV